MLRVNPEFRGIHHTVFPSACHRDVSRAEHPRASPPGPSRRSQSPLSPSDDRGRGSSSCQPPRRSRPHCPQPLAPETLVTYSRPFQSTRHCRKAPHPRCIHPSLRRHPGRAREPAQSCVPWCGQNWFRKSGRAADESRATQCRK